MATAKHACKLSLTYVGKDSFGYLLSLLTLQHKV